MYLGVNFFLDGFKKSIDTIIAVVFVIFVILCIVYIVYLRIERGSLQSNLDNLMVKYEIAQKELEYQKRLNEYHERNAEIASYAKEQITINHTHYLENSKETDRIIDEFNKSQKKDADILKVLNGLNDKFKEVK
jgi:hypothetical protein